MPVREFEDLLKKYVESKIINYKYHEIQYRKYSREKDRVSREYKNSGPTFNTGSVIAKPEENNDSVEAHNRIISNRVDELEDLMKQEKTFLDEVDEWIDECCKSDDQRKIIRSYMINNLCTDSEGVAECLKFSEIYIKKTKERFINKIIYKYF